MKLGVQSQIGSHPINSGEFIALIPFTKKGKSQKLQPGEIGITFQTTQQSVPSNLSESTWRDMVEDLSYLNSATNFEEPTCLPNYSDKTEGDLVNKNYARKRRKVCKVESNVGLAEDLIFNLLSSSSTHILDEDSCRKLLEILENVHCFLDGKFENCMFLSKVDVLENAQLKPSCSCLCPPWLTVMMKTFTFLNILTGFLQLHQETVTFDLVKDSLYKLRELGFCASVEDLKRLPELCPKVDY